MFIWMGLVATLLYFVYAQGADGSRRTSRPHGYGPLGGRTALWPTTLSLDYYNVLFSNFKEGFAAAQRK